MAIPDGLEQLSKSSICLIDDMPPFKMYGTLIFSESFSANFKSKPRPVPSVSIDVIIISLPLLFQLL